MVSYQSFWNKTEMALFQNKAVTTKVSILFAKVRTCSEKKAVKRIGAMLPSFNKKTLLNPSKARVTHNSVNIAIKNIDNFET
jgi:hypothetical protein